MQKKNLLALLASCLLISSAFGRGPQATAAPATKPTTKRENVQSVSPALERHTETRLLGEA